MNQLTAKGVVTMSSREIARLVQSKHGDVKRSAERLASAGILTAPLAHTPYTHPQNGQTYEEYWFNKRDSLVIVARLSPEFTAAVVDRWQELENSQAVSVPQTLPEALRLAADLAEQKEGNNGVDAHHGSRTVTEPGASQPLPVQYPRHGPVPPADACTAAARWRATGAAGAGGVPRGGGRRGGRVARR